MANILVLGAYGLLGSSLCPYLSDAGHTVFRQGRQQNADLRADPADPAALQVILSQHSVDTVVNLIALTNVDLCENDPQQAYQANVHVVESLSAAIQSMPSNMRAHLVHISSDHLYDGQGPHNEDRVNPCNVYALSKFAGELVAMHFGATVLRTNFIGHSHCAGKVSLTDWIVDSLRKGEPITAFDDVMISALHVKTLCKAIELAIQKKEPGIFNLGCKDGNSKAHLALRLAERLGLDRSLMSIGSSENVKLRTRRPLDMRLDSSRFEQIFNFQLPNFESQIDLAAQEYTHE